MPWNKARQQARHEVIFTDRALYRAVEARAQRAGMSIPDYLQALARAVAAMEAGDPILLSLLGITAPAPAEPPPAEQPRDNRLIDSALDQFGL